MIPTKEQYIAAKEIISKYEKQKHHLILDDEEKMITEHMKNYEKPLVAYFGILNGYDFGDTLYWFYNGVARKTDNLTSVEEAEANIICQNWYKFYPEEDF